MILNLIFILLAVLGAGGLWLGLNSFSPLWLLLLIPGFYIGIVILFFAGLLVAALCFPKKEPERSSAGARFTIWIVMQWLMQLMRLKIELVGEELLPQEPCIIVSNHRSDFDPMTVLSVLRHRKLIYISKEGNFKIPIVGAFIRRAGFYAIDRENGMRAMRTLKKAAERLQNEGMDVGIYPEGTRSKTCELLEFKTGAFYLAKKADAPIVVMTTTGTERISKNTPWRSTRVKLHFVERIEKDAVAAASMDELAAKTREIIEQALAQENK